MKKKNAFSLIELLVVATIIIVLTTVGLVSYRSANLRARDSKRKADLEQIRAALEMYRAENNQYPDNTGSLVPNYTKVVPTDPRDPNYFYVYQRGGTVYEYNLYAYLETGRASIISVSCGDKTCNYRVQNP